jgi:hypothetical protein
MIIAFTIPHATVPPETGDTEGVWLGGLLMIFCGLPLFILGLIVALVASIRSIKKDKNASRKPKG